MPEATLELIGCVGVHAVPMDDTAAIGDAVLALVGCMLNANPYRLETLVV